MYKIKKLSVILLISIITCIVLGSCGIKNEETYEEVYISDDKEYTEDNYVEKIHSTIDSIEDSKPQRDIVVCIDPGHYGGWNRISFNDGSSYSEGDITLQIALELKRILADEYGIECVMTRETPDINIDGYVNDALDNGKISLRGMKAEGCDFFISLHTNANLNYANGYETLYQPVSLNRPIIILNKVAINSEEAIRVANKVGTSITNALKKEKLTSVDIFKEIDESSMMTEWTDSLNDSLNTPGTLFYRQSNSGDGQDYYGVLRGAANVGVPGIIVEHSFHTVLEVREALLNGNLTKILAEADAKGIAEGFGVTKIMSE